MNSPILSLSEKIAFYKKEIANIADTSFNKQQKKLCLDILDKATEENIDKIYQFITQRVKTGFVFDIAPEVQHNCIALIEKDNKLSFESNALGEKLTHKLIIGENYDALKNLLAVYENKVDFIYIDPPYNTESTRTDGNSLTDIEGQNTGKFIYRDKYSRTGWLNMMNERLQLARKLLSDKGVIFISIDDNEQAYLKVLCDEVFGEENFVGTMIRKTASNRAMAKYFNCLHEYCLLYCKNIKYLDIKGELKDISNYTNPDNDPNGAWTSGDPSMSGSSNSFGVENPYTHKIDYPPKGRGWVFNQEKMKKLIESGQLVFKKEYRENERGFFLKQYLEGKSEYQLVNSMFFAKNDFLNQVATKHDMTMFDDIVFSNPKPVCFIKNLIKFSTQKKLHHPRLLRR